MPRFQFCPLEFDNAICKLPDSFCGNYRFCEYQTLSWSLPYYLDKNGFLIVTNLAELYRFTINESGNLVYPISFHDSTYSNIIRAAWQEAGWYQAIYNRNFVNCQPLVYVLDLNDYDSIPF